MTFQHFNKSCKRVSEILSHCWCTLFAIQPLEVRRGPMFIPCSILCLCFIQWLELHYISDVEVVYSTHREHFEDLQFIGGPAFLGFVDRERELDVSGVLWENQHQKDSPADRSQDLVHLVHYSTGANVSKNMPFRSQPVGGLSPLSQSCISAVLVIWYILIFRTISVIYFVFCHLSYQLYLELQGFRDWTLIIVYSYS